MDETMERVLNELEVGLEEAKIENKHKAILRHILAELRRTALRIDERRTQLEGEWEVSESFLRRRSEAMRKLGVLEWDGIKLGMMPQEE